MTGTPDAETAWTNWLDTMDGELRDTPKGAFPGTRLWVI